MTEDVSRRKALALLGLGAALGLTLSAALEPSEAEAQEAAGPPPRPPPPGHTGCNGGKGGAPVAMSGGTRGAPVNLRPPQQLQQNSDLSALERPTARFDELRIAVCSRLSDERDRRRKN